jgi:hypothetical protein
MGDYYGGRGANAELLLVYGCWSYCWFIVEEATRRRPEDCGQLHDALEQRRSLSLLVAKGIPTIIHGWGWWSCQSRSGEVALVLLSGSWSDRWWLTLVVKGGERCLDGQLKKWCVKESFFDQFSLWFLPLFCPKFTHIYKEWKRNMWSLLGINLSPWFKQEGSQPLAKSHYHKLWN